LFWSRRERNHAGGHRVGRSTGLIVDVQDGRLRTRRRRNQTKRRGTWRSIACGGDEYSRQQ
jgi:hypothetical protein